MYPATYLRLLGLLAAQKLSHETPLSLHMQPRVQIVAAAELGHTPVLTEGLIKKAGCNASRLSHPQAIMHASTWAASLLNTWNFVDSPLRGPVAFHACGTAKATSSGANANTSTTSAAQPRRLPDNVLIMGGPMKLSSVSSTSIFI